MEYNYRKIEMPTDYEGEVVITLLNNRKGVSSGKAILYIHGYIDYFFQDHLAERAVKEGYNFYAVDLRKYGRSLLKGQHFNYCRSIDEYFADITKSIEYMLADGCRDITLLGHSTGGLIATLYSHRGERRGDISALVLNSPFFEFNTPWIKRIVIPITIAISKLLPYSYQANQINENYSRSIDIDKKGEWSYNKKLKPANGVPLYYAWIAAIYKAHKQVKQGLNIRCRVLVMSSSHSTNPKQWCDSAMVSDTVLNVKDILNYSKRIGDRVEQISIEEGLHDLFLSKEDVRERALSYMFSWIGE